MKASHFSPDIQDFIRLLSIHHVRYVIVGGEAVIYYGHARLTGDIDIFYESSPENTSRLYAALKEFWGGTIPGIKSAEEFLQAGLIVQFGVPPNRIDLINKIGAVSFEDAWRSRTEETINLEGKAYPLYFIGLEHLIHNKTAVKRPKDLEDLKFLKSLT